MNQHTAIDRQPRRITKAAPKPARLQSISLGARKAVDIMNRASAMAAAPLAASLKQEEPKTLAKMALAALAPTLGPRLALTALRFAIRNPLIVAASIGTFAIVATLVDDRDATTT